MENLNVEERARLEETILNAITEFLEEPKSSAEEILVCDEESQSSNSSYNSVISKRQLSPSILQEARTAALTAKLAAVKKRNTLLNQISEQKSKLSEIKLEMEIEQSKAQEAVFMKYYSESKPSRSKADYYCPESNPSTSKPDRYCLEYPSTSKADHYCLESKPSTSKDYNFAAHKNTKRDQNTNDTNDSDTERNESEPKHTQHSMDLLKRIHLPKMTMETFSGDIMKYSSFLRQFQNNIVSKTDDEEEKLYYLDQLTSGKPNDIVKTCLHLPAGKGYREARSLLDKRYGDKSKVATALVSKILSWPSIHSNDVSGLDEFAIFLRGCLNSLKKYSIGIGRS